MWNLATLHYPNDSVARAIYLGHFMALLRELDYHNPYARWFSHRVALWPLRG